MFALPTPPQIATDSQPHFLVNTYFMYHSQPSQKGLGPVGQKPQLKCAVEDGRIRKGCEQLALGVLRFLQGLSKFAKLDWPFEPLILAKKSECHNCIDSPNKGFFQVWNLRTKTSPGNAWSRRSAIGYSTACRPCGWSGSSS